ncbi:MAG: DUF4262 domain-containing protein [Myxococcota bacterium]
MHREPDEYEREMLEIIEEHGWFSQGVFDPDGTTPSCRYTVGFAREPDLPELIVLGLPLDVMHHMLWQVFDRLQDGAVIREGAEWPGLLAGDYVCVTRRVPEARIAEAENHLATWYWRYRGYEGTPPLYQLVWPSTGSKQYPWDEGCPADVVAAQGRLLFDR